MRGVVQLLSDGDISSWLDAFRYWTEFGIESSGLVDLYSGRPITRQWMEELPKRSPQWFADYFVGQYYTPSEDYGIGAEWQTVRDQLLIRQRQYLVGRPIGPRNNKFDPTGNGSYFRNADEVCAALEQFPATVSESLARYVDLLERCGAASMGVYVRIV